MQNNSPNQPGRRPPIKSIDGFNYSRLKQRHPSVQNEALRQHSAPSTSLPPMPAKTPPPTVAPTPSLPPADSRYRFKELELAETGRGSLKSRRQKRHKWSLRRKVLSFVAIVIIAAIGLGGWDVWQLDHKVNHLSVGNLSASVSGAENILVAGSTNRCNLKVQNAQWGFCSQGVTGINSDIIFIVHVVPKTHTVSLLSIPRDTFVPNARSGDEAFKIDAALYQGPTQLVNAVEEDFGIPIQHYAEVGFDGFVNIVNAVGGVKMDFPMPVYDSESYLDVKTAGCRVLNGVEALQVVRARHLQYEPPTLDTSDVNLWPQEPESDIARIARTHEFLRVLASTVDAKGLGNPITDQKLVDALAPQVQVDSGLSTAAMLQLMEELHSVNINNVPQYTLPIATTTFGSYEYSDQSFGDVVFPVETTDQQVINEFLGVSNSTDTMTGKPLPKASSINVSVVNASGTPNQAAQTTAALGALGFNMTGIPGTTTPLSSETLETVVAYASSKTEVDAETVARQLSGPVILSENASLVKSGSEVTVLTGTSLVVNSKSAPSTTASSSSTTTKTTASTTTASTQATSSSSTTTASATGLAPASSANQPLTAWDPRACTD